MPAEWCCSVWQMLIAQELKVMLCPLYLCSMASDHSYAEAWPLTMACWCGLVGTFSYTFCCFKQKPYYLSHPFQRKGFFFFFSFHLTLQSILFCADVGGRMLESSLAKGQVCLSNKNKQTAKCEGEAGLETT